MKLSPLVRVPLMTSLCLLIFTSAMPPSFTCSMNVEYGISCTAPDRALKLLTTVATTTAITIHRTMFLARSFNSLDLETPALPRGRAPIQSRSTLHQSIPTCENVHLEAATSGRFRLAKLQCC